MILLAPITVDITAPTLLLAVAPTAVAISAVIGVPGPPGPSGAAGNSVIGEIPAGLINGANTVFITASNFTAGSTAVYFNGLREIGYAETPPNRITFSSPPLLGDQIVVDYAVA